MNFNENTVSLKTCCFTTMFCIYSICYEHGYDMENMLNFSNKELNMFRFHFRNKKERNEMECITILTILIQKGINT